MTEQVREKLYIYDNEYQIQGEPLSKYLNKKGIFFTSPHTACGRGYIGTWEIKDQKLYLIDILGFTENGDVGMGYLFKNSKEIIAYWFFGDLCVPLGKVLKYVHPGYNSVYEKELVFHIEGGFVKTQKIKDNRTNEVKKIDFREYFLEDLKKKILKCSIEESISMFEKEIQKFKKVFRNNELENNDNSMSNYCVMVDLSGWSQEDKNELFLYALRGINYFTFVLNNCKSFPIGDFNSVLKAINGNNTIYINRKGIKWYSEYIKNKLKTQGVLFDDSIADKTKRYVNTRENHHYYENETYEEYNDSYAQDVENLSDQFINDVFDRDPDLYWNID